MTMKTNSFNPHLLLFLVVLLPLLLLQGLGFKQLLLLLFWKSRHDPIPPIPRIPPIPPIPPIPQMRPSGVVMEQSYGGGSGNYRGGWFRSLKETLEKLVFFVAVSASVVAWTKWKLTEPTRHFLTRRSVRRQSATAVSTTTVIVILLLILLLLFWMPLFDDDSLEYTSLSHLFRGWFGSLIETVVNSVRDWFRSLIDTVVEILSIAVVFMCFLVWIKSTLFDKPTRCIPTRTSVPPPSSPETTSTMLVWGQLDRFGNEATPGHIRGSISSSSAIPTSQYPSTKAVGNSMVNLDHPTEARSKIHKIPGTLSCSSIPHQSSLKSFFAKNPEQNGLSGQRECTLRQWLQNRKALGIGPLMEYKVPKSSATVIHVRDDIKVLIRSFVEFLQGHHSRGYSMTGILRVEDLFVGQESINIKNLKLVPFSEDLQKKDYYRLVVIIKRFVFEEDAKQIPYDMEHFLTLLNNPKQNMYLVGGHVHVALMNSKDLRYFIMFLWEKKKSLEPKLYSKWAQAINQLTGIDGWSKLIDTESPLYEVYKGGKYKDTQKLNLIRFFRNATAHLIDYSDRGKLFNFEHIALIIIASFPNTVADIQERLNHHGILQEFMDFNTTDSALLQHPS